ncbi:hypothetical protein MVEN_01256200 [Mycena venus]|uniref:Uncharacterized protein n=1 Tax=Mycena venus TaxID=2733690 RepID=A0A8H6Y5R3_9AGAR|nr:hypothetical protein MVEN_01256200 [Mycena venus]
MPDVPCPYTTFLMATAWCVDLEEPIYGSGVSFKNSVMEAHMGSTEGDNNDGITVIDITDPTNPSYCFVSIFGLEAGGAVKDRVPLTAEQYCRAYYPVPKDSEKDQEGVKETEEDVQKKIDALRDERLMKLDVLVEAWPREYKSSVPTEPAEDATTDTPGVASNPVPSLADLSLKPAIEHGLETGETEGLEDLVWHPGKADLMWPILRNQKPFPDSGMSLLTKVVQHEVGSDKSLDLSGFSLSDSQLASLLTFAGVEEVELLNLSHNSIFTADGLRQILPSTPKLRRLVLLGTSISDEQIYELLKEEPKLFLSVEELTHPAFISWQDGACYPNGFAYVGVHSGQNACSASLAVFTPATVVQALTDLLGPIADLNDYEAYGLFGTSLVPQAAFATGVRGEGQPWRERHVHCFPAVSDMPFDGRGWLFCATWASMFDRSGTRYGFVKVVDAQANPPKVKIYDLKAWLEEMAAEGRPPASGDAVKKLESIFADLGSRKEGKLWTEEDLLPFMQKFVAVSRRRY